MDFKKHCICEFGKYVKPRDDYVVTNNMTPWTREAIYMGPSVNLQLAHKVLCLETGIMLNQRVNKVVPIPYWVIKKINKWDEITKRKEYGRKLKFLNRTKEKYDWDNDEIKEGKGLLEDEEGPLTELTAELPVIEIKS